MKKVIPLGSALQSSGAMPAPISTPRPIPSPDETAEQHLLLVQRLAGCIHAEELLGRFFRWVGDLELADGLGFMQAEKDSLSFGQRKHHSASYELTLEGVNLGRLTLYRRSRFAESELLFIEQALGSLARCLSSALEFARLRELATRDPLTGLGNRHALDEWIKRELSRTRRYASPLSVMMIDVDHFKAINDHLGHFGADDVLRIIARVFAESTRGSDLVFRFGGDEFAILLPHTDIAGACETSRQIRKNLERVSREEFGLNAKTPLARPNVSIGVAAYIAGDDEDSLLQRADTHLYHAKGQGRGRTCHQV
jgi:diguanylate cyclase (GGDEF)-like protein